MYLSLHRHLLPTPRPRLLLLSLLSRAVVAPAVEWELEVTVKFLMTPMDSLARVLTGPKTILMGIIKLANLDVLDFIKTS